MGIIVAAGLKFSGSRSAAPENRPAASGFTLEAETTAYAGYGGSESCKECHRAAYEAWAKSHHGLAERVPGEPLDDAAFAPGGKFQHGSQLTSVQKSGNTFQLRTEGPHGTQQIFQVDRIIGHNPLRQMLVSFPDGRWQATEACFDPRSNEWFNVYGDEDRRAGEWGHWTGRGMNWNSMCATCHNTRLRKNYDLTNDVYRTAMVERGVGCESCHGPMKAHNDWQYANKGKSLADPTIKRLSRDQMFDTCAACHSRRGEITGDPKSGDAFFDHHLLSIVDESETFYADGQVRDEDYEVSAFLGSRMSHKGVRCIDCHDFHSAKVRVPGNLMCLSCHGPNQTNAPVINPVTHSRHKVFGFDTNGVMQPFDLSSYKPGEIKETGGECVNCHMPQTVYMQRHSRHDHGFTIPDPLLTKQFGIPNACNRCHQDKDVDWALGYVGKWYGEKMNRPSRQRAQFIAHAQLGDESAREPLVQMLRSEEQPYWRAVAANLLERWVGDQRVAEALIERLDDTNALVRQNAVQTLATLGEPLPAEIRTALSSRLSDPSRNVRVVAAQALASSVRLDSLAGSELRHMLRHNADQPAGQLQLGSFALSRGDLTNAIRHYETAVRWDPHSAPLRHELAITYNQIGRANDAARELQEAVRLAPGDAEFHFKLALALHETGEARKALGELESAVKLDPGHARAAYNLGLARSAAGDPIGAIEALRSAERAAPNDPRIPYARATIHARLGDLDPARTAARRALQLDSEYTEAATLLQRLGSD